MALVPVATSNSNPSVEGYSEANSLIPHHVRQALQSLGVPIDANDHFDDDAVSLEAIVKAYANFAKAV